MQILFSLLRLTLMYHSVLFDLNLFTSAESKIKTTIQNYIPQVKYEIITWSRSISTISDHILEQPLQYDDILTINSHPKLTQDIKPLILELFF